jgi:hypothetical protein
MNRNAQLAAALICLTGAGIIFWIIIANEH